MVLYRATLSYDGTDFEGWQCQAGGREARTVQGEVERALAQLAGGGLTRVAAAGRTDSGVHALAQVIAFELARDWDALALQRALNSLLPRDVRVLETARAAPQFHPRRSALGKLYRYELDTAPVQLPIRRRYAAHLPLTLDEPRVVLAAALFLGRHDFASLASSGGSVKTSVRTVTRSDARFVSGTLLFEVEADGFLRKMVRSMVGGLIAAGRGSHSPDELRQALAACDRSAWPPPAEARGLTLVRVHYPPEFAGVT